MTAIQAVPPGPRPQGRYSAVLVMTRLQRPCWGRADPRVADARQAALVATSEFSLLSFLGPGRRIAGLVEHHTGEGQPRQPRHPHHALDDPAAPPGRIYDRDHGPWSPSRVPCRARFLGVRARPACWPIRCTALLCGACGDTDAGRLLWLSSLAGLPNLAGPIPAFLGRRGPAAWKGPVVKNFIGVCAIISGPGRMCGWFVLLLSLACSS